ncbi:MAG: adenylyl-sulfate kinase [Burkholderiales bacterium]
MLADARASRAMRHFCRGLSADPFAVCSQRDPEGLYARAGKLSHMTGVDDPYEPPQNPELQLNGGEFTVEQTVSAIITLVAQRRRI